MFLIGAVKNDENFVSFFYLLANSLPSTQWVRE
jgi:hypothetical protein